MKVLKVAVVVSGNDGPGREVLELLEKGYIDAVQFHGDESPAALRDFSYPAFKALSLKDKEDADEIRRFPGPRVLVDAWSRDGRGGTGKRLDGATVEAAAEIRPLWLAGGLSPDNIRSVIEEFRPELVDASSHLEAEKGRKDHGKLKDFFREIEHACIQ